MKTHRLLLSSWLVTTTVFAQSGTGPVIEQRLSDLRQNAELEQLPEIPTDQSLVPPGWLGLVSWNVQVGGVSTSPTAARPPMVADALGRLFSGTYQLLAAQEVSGSGNSGVLTDDLLPGEPNDWSASFVDTTDTQDNGFWFRSSVQVRDERTLFVTSMMDGSGRLVTDPDRSVHPPRAAHFTINDFDFTLITLHLTFAGGDTAESAREMGVVLDYLDEYFQEPGHDPDVIISGDFNIPSRLSGATGSGSITLDPIFDDDPRFQVGERRFVVTVHEPTSRRSVANGGTPANNYDHFILSADALEEFVQARRVDTVVLTANEDDPEQRLTSDHFPVVAFFQTLGAGIQPDVMQGPFSISAVVSAASFEPEIVSGSWVSIFGENLAPTSRIFRAAEIVDGVLPTELDGVSVLINGKPAALSFIGPRQLNVQVPNDDSVGPVSVEVSRDGLGSATETAELVEASPAFFMFDQENRRFIAAVHLDGVFVGKTDLFGGVLPARPAKPGDIVQLFGNGFGPTDPEVPSGRLFSGAAFLEADMGVLIGGIEARVLFAGLSAAGLNQLNVVIPEGLPGGDVEVVADTLGRQTQAGAFLTLEGEPPVVPPTQGIVVISQVYGGGGNQGATLTNDYIELFNRGNGLADLTGWTVQYASATGSRWSATPLSGSIQPGQYFLIQEGMGQTGGSLPLPNPDVTGGIGLSASSGKIALVMTGELLSGTAPSGPQIVDFVGYGSAEFAEGMAAPRLSNTTALVRAGGGCVDTNNNSSDFSEETPMPRNTQSPSAPCQ